MQHTYRKLLLRRELMLDESPRNGGGAGSKAMADVGYCLSVSNAVSETDVSGHICPLDVC
jgi:hypothetical protein